MEYTISFQNPLDHFVDIRLTCPSQDRRSVDFLLPAWRPGRYELANYAQNIRNFKSEDAQGQPLSSNKVSRNKWRVFPKANSRTLVISYRYYAYQPDAGGSLLDDRQLYLNFINCLLYVEERLHLPCSVNLKIAKNFRIACGLPGSKKFRLEAKDYYQLVDSPLLASPHLKHWKFRQSGIQVNLWFMGSHRLTKSKVLKDFKAFIRTQVDTMGSFPEEDFHFLLQVPPNKIYHGVEHANSTVIALGPGTELHKSRYIDFLGVSSHEFFHCWNVIKIRPRELLPYDFQREVYFDTGFIAEGITTYYGDLFLVRSKVFDLKQYFRELNTLFKRHFENEGRHYASLVDSSRDLWVDGYTQGAPGRKVSIYTKGALISLMLDLTIRKCTFNKGSLDDVMRLLWENFGKKSQGYSLTDFEKLCERVAGQSLGSFFRNFVYGTDPLEKELDYLLSYVGCQLRKVPSKQLSKKIFGFRTTKQEQELKVLQVAPGSPAYGKLSIGDVIVAVNGKKPKHKLNQLIDSAYSLRLDIRRQGRKVSCTLPRAKDRYFSQFRIEKLDRVTAAQKASFKKWLGASFG